MKLSRHNGLGPWRSHRLRASHTVDRSGRGEVWRKAEARAAQHLSEQGLLILDRNWSDSRGELDLVALDGEELVFVEVRGLSTDEFVRPAQTVTLTKQRQVFRTAVRWLSRHPEFRDGKYVRFDVIGLALEPGRLEHIPRAFVPGDLASWPR